MRACECAWVRVWEWVMIVRVTHLMEWQKAEKNDVFNWLFIGQRLIRKPSERENGRFALIGSDPSWTEQTLFSSEDASCGIFPLVAVLWNVLGSDSIWVLKKFFCSTALTRAGWVRMTIKPRHCPPTKQCGCHWISANISKKNCSEKIWAENRTRAAEVRSFTSLVW